MEEQALDVSWMTHGKDKLGRNGSVNRGGSPKNDETPSSTKPLESTTPSDINGKQSPPVPTPSPPSSSPTPATVPKPIPPPKFGSLSRSASADKLKENGSTPPQRRGSWFSSMASKFSTSPGNSTVNQPPAANGTAQPDDADDDVTPLPKIVPNKNAVLPHATRQTGNAPYVPAPPRSNQPGFLGVFRRLSSSSGPNMPTSKAANGLVERKILNVDKNRERCRLNDLSQSKLRRVAFCVDVEIAPMPKYADEEPAPKKANEKPQKQKMEKGEGDALKDPEVLAQQKEKDGVVKSTGEKLPQEPAKEGVSSDPEQNIEKSAPSPEPIPDEPKTEKETTRKKEKKKKSEAERKAKKEQKKKEALEKGAIPMEIHFDSDSSEGTPSPATLPKVQSPAAISPGRIYRRCCQLRETDILTKITHQLPKSTEACTDGIVEKLDLTGYYMSLSDLVTLGDFLAVVPIREVVLENCGLSDEGMRVVLAGLLAARRPQIRSRRSSTVPADLTTQGGVVERLVLKDNKIGIEGWKHLCVFVHLCRSIKCLDLSGLSFPAQSEPAKSTTSHHHLTAHPHLLHRTASNNTINSQNNGAPLDLASLFSRSLVERLAGSNLELLNIGATGVSATQLGVLLEGALKSGVTRLGLSHINMDAQGAQHVAKYLREGKVAGLDLGGNDLRDHLDTIADAVEENSTLWAISLAGCSLTPSALSKIFPRLAKLSNLKFLDLSHNHDLFETQPSAIGLLRRYLPKMAQLRRFHVADVSMSSEQAIALAEVLPEVTMLAHINLLENNDLIDLADARTEEAKEEACALYASLLAAARVSNTLVKIDIDNPSVESGEIVKALANQVVAHCLQNLHRVPDILNADAGDSGKKLDQYPDVLRHLVGIEDDHAVAEATEAGEPAPNDDYVIGGTGVAKALACVLKNRGHDSNRQSGEYVKDVETGVISAPRANLPSSKAKDMSKHLLATARKIRARLGPALAKAKASSKEDIQNYQRLVFLDQTIVEIIKRFEDEFPETRQEASPGAARPGAHSTSSAGPGRGLTAEPDPEPVFLSDAEDLETDLQPSSRSRSNSIMSHTSKALAEEEGMALRAGHQFRAGFLRPEHYDLISGNDKIMQEPSHERMVVGVLDELYDENPGLRKKVLEMGPVKTFEADRVGILKMLRDKDPQYWDRFIESQEKARANVKVEAKAQPLVGDEEAIAD